MSSPAPRPASAATGSGRPRVLQVVQRFLPELGGLETHVAEVTRRLASQGEFDVTVLTTDRSGDLPRTESMNGYQVLRRRSWPRNGDLYLSPGLVPAIARGGWDLVHFQGVNTLVPPVGMMAASAARLPYVLTFHSGGHSSPSRSAIRSTQWRALAPLLRHADHLIAVSRFERGYFAAATGIGLDRFTVIGNGGALPPAASDVVPVPGRIVSSGRLERYKGHHRAIEALPAIRQQIPEAHVVILGAGPYESELREITTRLGLDDAVQIRSLPPSDRGAMARELASASVMAALSSYEAHPVGVMEAVVLGLPVVGFDIAGTGDLVEEGLVAGIPATASNAEVAVALVEALRRTEARGPLPHSSVAVNLPTWESSAEALAQVYRGVLSGQKTR